MSSKIIPVITNMGLEALKSLKVSITHIAIGIYDKKNPDGYTPDPINAELRNEVFRKKIKSASIDDSNTLHIEAILEEDDFTVKEYNITEIGFILKPAETEKKKNSGGNDEVLFAIFAHKKGIIASKTKERNFYITFDLSIFTNQRSGDISEFSKSKVNIEKQTVCRSEDHKLIEGDIIKVTNSCEYEGNYQICNVTLDSFNINKKYTTAEPQKASWKKEYEVSYKIDANYNDATLRETLFQGVNLITISTQKEFDQIFNLGDDTKVPANSTIVLSPIQGSIDKNGEDTFNGRVAYVLKNTLLLSSNTSIIGFNTNNTIVTKISRNIHIQLIGKEFSPIKGVELKGWSFDGQGGINNFGGEFTSNQNGGAFYLSHAENCNLNCQIINHRTTAKGGGIYGTLDCKNIIAENISSNKDIYGNDVYGCTESLFKGIDCKIISNNSCLFNYESSKIEIVDHNLSSEVLKNTNNERLNDPELKESCTSKEIRNKLPRITTDQKELIKLATIEDIREGTSNELAISTELLKEVFNKIRTTVDPTQ